MDQLSLGKVRALQTAFTERGAFTILAVDHRDVMRAMLNRSQPETVPARQLTEIKLSVVKLIGPFTTAILLAPIYSMGQAIAGTYAHPWYERYQAADVNEHWYQDYRTS